MQFIKRSSTNIISWIILILISIQVTITLSSFTDVPRKLGLILKKLKEDGVFFSILAPPARPERFHSREELKRYLQLVCLNFYIVLCNKINIFFLKVHEYYAIIGRPRFGRSLTEKPLDTQDRHLFNFFDVNGDKLITFNEFYDRLGNK
jgi:hypothetical protein